MKFEDILKLLGVIVLIYFIYTLDSKTFFSSSKLLNFTLVIKLLVVSFLLLLVRAIRWQLIVRKISGIEIKFGFSFVSTICGIAAGSVLPGRIDLSKPLLLRSNYKIPIKESLSGVFIERTADVFVVFVILIYCLISLNEEILPQKADYGKIFSFFLLLLIIGYLLAEQIHKLLLFAQKSVSNRYVVSLINLLEIFVKNLLFLKSDKKLFFSVILTTFASLIFDSLRVYILFNSLGVEITFIEANFIFYFTVVIGLLSFIPGAIGISELTYSEITQTVSGEGNFELIKSVVFLDRVIGYYLIVGIGSIIIILNRQLFRNMK